MYKCAGTVNYPFGSISQSDPSKTALGYRTREEADYHTNLMNVLRLTFDETWNKNYWTKQPEEWITIEFSKQH